MLTLLKLGGSLITDKRGENVFRQETCARIASEIAQALAASADVRLIIGHGSGSFGHVAANRHKTIAGVQTSEQWYGFTEVAAVASQLNDLVVRTLHAAGLPAWPMQPSASAVARGGVIQRMALEPIKAAVEHSIIPVVYGDVALDEILGGTIISTETVLTYLAQNLPVDRIVLAGDVPGVLDEVRAVIPLITPANVEHYRPALGGSGGTDVTGGMLTKVTDMVALVERFPSLEVNIVDGTESGVLKAALTGQRVGTLIRAG